MAKSAELYTLCDVCDGMGVAVDSELNSPIDRKCLVCGGRRYLPLGLNKSQVDAALRKAGEVDALKADNAYMIDKIAELTERLTAYRQGVLLTTDAPPEVTVHWQDDDFFTGIEDANDGD